MTNNERILIEPEVNDKISINEINVNKTNLIEIIIPKDNYNEIRLGDISNIYTNEEPIIKIIYNRQSKILKIGNLEMYLGIHYIHISELVVDNYSILYIKKCELPSDIFSEKELQYPVLESNIITKFDNSVCLKINIKKSSLFTDQYTLGFDITSDDINEAIFMNNSIRNLFEKKKKLINEFLNNPEDHYIFCKNCLYKYIELSLDGTYYLENLYNNMIDKYNLYDLLNNDFLIFNKDSYVCINREFYHNFEKIDLDESDIITKSFKESIISKMDNFMNYKSIETDSILKEEYDRMYKNFVIKIKKEINCKEYIREILDKGVIYLNEDTEPILTNSTLINNMIE